MECISEDSAVCFFFTKYNHFAFNIGLAAVQFENKDPDMIENDQIGGIMTNTAGGRLKKGNKLEHQVPVGADITMAGGDGELKQEAASAAVGSQIDGSS